MIAERYITAWSDGWERMSGGLMVDSENNMDNPRTTSNRSRANRRAHPFRCRGRVRPRSLVLSKVVEVVSNLTNVLLLKRCAQGNQIRPQRNFRILEEKTEAYIGEVWYTIARNTMTHNPQGKRITSENLAGQVTTTAWDQFACTSVDELISAAKNAKSVKHACDFDDIGNRESSSERGTNSVYAANQLNRYCSITTLTSDVGLQTSSFPPQFDDDGNQTLIKTSTGICCEDFIKKVKDPGEDPKLPGGFDWDEREWEKVFAQFKRSDNEWMTYLRLNVFKFVAGVNAKHACRIVIGCAPNCEDDVLGTANYKDEFHFSWKGSWTEHVAYAKVCMDQSGRTRGDFCTTAKTLYHELIHAQDQCQKSMQFSCGDFTEASINRGDFDDKPCTEIHAYSQEHLGVVPADAALDKAKAVEMAVQSVKTACGLDKADPKAVDKNFYIKLLERATRKYESCKRWME